jgi:hypothetical protein
MSAGVFFGAGLLLAGVVPVLFGLVTGAMPPFPNKYKYPRDWCTTERDEDPVGYWLNGGAYGAVAACGCYLIVTHW